MDPVAIAGLLKDYGAAGMLALALVAIGILWNRLQTTQDGRLEDTKQANATVYAALKTLDNALDFVKDQK